MYIKTLHHHAQSKVPITDYSPLPTQYPPIHKTDMPLNCPSTKAVFNTYRKWHESEQSIRPAAKC